ncbi:MAG: hypothetical protein QOJ35_1534 [Solirubrobacteraceae bacterium]|jgi:SAM-dependent methyltransferase|nr:hypothetical protein [Solirubrobacteraceae bacterium]
MLATLAIPLDVSAIRRALTPRRFSGAQRRPAPARVESARHGASHAAGASAPVAVRPRTIVLPPLAGEVPAIDVVAVSDPEALPTDRQLLADAIVAELEAQVRHAECGGHEQMLGLANAERYPSLPQWLALRGSALALRSLFAPSGAERLAYGFDFDDFLAPRFDGASAVELLRALLGPERAGRIVDRHRAFCDAPMTDEARLLMAGAIDARAIRQSAVIAAQAIVARRERWGDDVRLAAVGAGTGDAFAELAATLGARWPTLVDNDPMALAAAEVVMSQRLPAANVRSHLAYRGTAGALAEADVAGFDVIDLTGAMHTLDDRDALQLLQCARLALRPGGVVVTANMLDERPLQLFFDRVLRWPGVIQRSPARLAQLVAAAGFREDRLSLAIPANAPVHVVATIDTAA